jgi:hypothetical protein
MAPQYARGDAMREYLTGAGSDGGAQADPAASLGNFRSSTPAATYGITIANPISGVVIDYASGGNARGQGVLHATTTDGLKWQQPGSASPGPVAYFTGPGEAGVVESNENPGAYVRVTATPPFSLGQSQINLDYLVSDFYGFPEVSEAEAAAGVSHYRAGIIRNESGSPVTLFSRWVAALAGAAVSDAGQLPAAGAGTIGATASLAGWPDSGYVRIVTNAGALREIAYYASRTSSTLNVAARGLLGTSAAAGLSTDLIYPVPGVAIALAVDGVEAFGSAIASIADANTPPAGVTWKTGISAAEGVSVASVNSNQQFGVWYWRQIPAGAMASGRQLIKFGESFSAY